jgi:hypothetical protein
MHAKSSGRRLVQRLKIKQEEPRLKQTSFQAGICQSELEDFQQSWSVSLKSILSEVFECVLTEAASTLPQDVVIFLLCLT